MKAKKTNGGLEAKADCTKEVYRRGRAIFAGLDGERRNVDKGLAFLEAAAIAGNLDAYAEFAYLSALEKEEIGVEGLDDEDPNVATENRRKYIQKIKEAEETNPYAGFLLAAMLAEGGDLIAKDEKRAASIWKKAMARLRRRAENDALDAFCYGNELRIATLDDSDSKKEKWWRYLWDAFARKNADAKDEAERWLLKSAEAGYARAATVWFSSCCVFEEPGDGKKRKKALQLLERAATEQEDATAALFLGLGYLNGRVGDEYDRAAGIDWLYRAAEGGDTDAMTNLGDICAGVVYKKEGEEPDYESAVYWYSRAATLGDAAANVKVGDAYRLGKGVKKSAGLACFWYRGAVAEGDGEGMRKLAWAFYYGEGVEKDLEKAKLHFSAAVEKGNGEAARDLGDLYALGDGFPKDDEEAAVWFRKGVELGDDESIARLVARLDGGIGAKVSAEESRWLRKCYEDAAPKPLGACDEAVEALTRRLSEGINKEANRKEAELWRRSAAEKNIAFWRGVATELMPESLRRLGIECLEKGDEKNVEEGLRYLRQAAELGCSNAAIRLGCVCFEGERVEQDVEEALGWFRKAAELGNGEGANIVAGFYNEGLVVDQDREEAFRWYRKASDLGFSEALVSMGIMFLDGNFERDVDKALGYLREAVDAGSANAAYLIGTIYDDGELLAEDPGEALKWFRKAGEMGSVEAAVHLGELYRDGEDADDVDDNFNPVKPDWNEAARWFSQAAETEEAGWCAYALFLLYDQAGDCEGGATLDKDDAEALRALRQAAGRTSDLVGPKAKHRLGEVYEFGEFGVEANVDAARQLYRDALATLDEIGEREAAFLFDDESDEGEANILDAARERLLSFATTDVEADLREALEQAMRRLER